MSTHHQLNFGPAPLRRSEQAARADKERAAAKAFDQALKTAEINNKEVAHLCGVSQSLVEKWRNPEQRAFPNLFQMWLLPVEFWVAFHKEHDDRAGFGRAALLDLLGAIGRLAVTR